MRVRFCASCPRGKLALDGHTRRCGALPSAIQTPLTEISCDFAPSPTRSPSRSLDGSPSGFVLLSHPPLLVDVRIVTPSSAFTCMAAMDLITTEPDPAEHLMTVPEICARLGISRSTFYDWRQARKAPPCLVLPNSQLRVRETDFARWINERMETAF